MVDRRLNMSSVEGTGENKNPKYGSLVTSDDHTTSGSSNTRLSVPKLTTSPA
jgi:hypothetical protein